MIWFSVRTKEYTEHDYDSDDSKKELRNLIKSEFKKRKVSHRPLLIVEGGIF